MTRTAVACALSAALVALPATAQEDLTWIAGTAPEGASILYGLPNSDFIRVGLRCDATTFGVTVAFYPDNNPAAGLTKTELAIAATDVATVVPATVTHLEMMDDYLVEAAMPVDEDLRSLLTSGPTLTFTFDNVPAEIPAPPVELAEAFIAACAAFRG